MINWIVFVVAIILVMVALEREIYFYEGVHLGPRIQGWLYDRWAKKYDHDKKESQKNDNQVLAIPLINALKEVSSPLVLDVATGTGRLPFSLLSNENFHGYIVALDISKGMLTQAAQKLVPFSGRFSLLQKSDMPLPFPDNTFDAITCMEALEVMPEMETPLSEFARVLRPGGVLLSSRGTEESGRVNKVRSVNDLTELLTNTGFIEIDIAPWWKLFDRVWARLPGKLASRDAKSALEHILYCPKCMKPTLKTSSEGMLSCENCQHELQVDENNIIIF